MSWLKRRQARRAADQALILFWDDMAGQVRRERAMRRAVAAILAADAVCAEAERAVAG